MPEKNGTAAVVEQSLPEARDGAQERLGMRVVGDSRDEESRDWDDVRRSVSILAKSMNLPSESDRMKNSVPKIRKKTSVRKAGSPPSLSPEDEDEEGIQSTDFIDDSLPPPFDLEALCRLYENSGALRRNVDAMVTNIDGFGHQVKPILDFRGPEIDKQISDILLRKAVQEIDDLMTLKMEDLKRLIPSEELVQETKELWSTIASIEKGRLNSFFGFVNPLETFIKLRRSTRQDLELLGNSGWEVIRKNPLDPLSPITDIYHVPFTNVRLIKADKKPHVAKVRVKVDPVHYDTISVQRHFRRFVRVVGNARTYYREFGDDRVMSRSTGMRFKNEAALRESEGEHAQVANELFHWQVRSPTSAYGVPRWIGELVSVLGSRAAEEVNLLYFDNKAIPPMVLLVSGGRVTQDSVDRIATHIEDEIKGKKNFHKILILEAVASGDEETQGKLESSGKMRFELKPLMKELPQDALFQEYDSNNQIKIGRAFRQPPLLTGDTRDMNRACYSEDTETLTENGWKLIDEIGPNEKVAAYDPEKHKVVFSVPTERHIYEVENELLYEFENVHTSVLVTAEHKMLARSFYSRTENESRWRGIEAKDLRLQWSRFRFRVAPDGGSWVGEKLDEEFSIPRLRSCVHLRKDGHQHEPVKVEDFAEFLGYWISEGSLLQTNDPMSKHWVTLSQKKPKIREKIQELMDRLPWRYSVQETKDGTTRWKISNKCLRDYLLQNCGGKSSEKKIPLEFMRAEQRILVILYSALMAGDGSIDPRENRTSRSYYTKSTMLADQFQELTLLLGFRSQIAVGAQCWRINHSLHVETSLKREEHVRLVPYTGRVYCFSVPEFGYFVTRRNGKVAIQGNTAEIAKAVTEEQVYQPERDEFDASIDRHFLPSLLIHFWTFKTNAPVQRFPDSLIDNVRKVLLSGAVTPNEVRPLIGDAFSMDFDHRPEEWAQAPPNLVMAATRQFGEIPDEPVTPGQEAKAEGSPLARGRTSRSDSHEHDYVAVRRGDEVVLEISPGPEDGHVHSADPVPFVPGEELILTLGEEGGHTHTVSFTPSELAKARQRRVDPAAKVILALREAIYQEFQEEKDEFLKIAQGYSEE